MIDVRICSFFFSLRAPVKPNRNGPNNFDLNTGAQLYLMEKNRRAFSLKRPDTEINTLTSNLTNRHLVKSSGYIKSDINISIRISLLQQLYTSSLLNIYI